MHCTRDVSCQAGQLCSQAEEEIQQGQDEFQTRLSCPSIHQMHQEYVVQYVQEMHPSLSCQLDWTVDFSQMDILDEAFHRTTSSFPSIGIS